MSTDLQDPALSTQTTDGNQGATQTPTPSDTVSGETTVDQSAAADIDQGEIGPKNLPPELEETRKQLMRDYHNKLNKTKEDKIRFEREMEKLKGESSTLQQLLQQEWFRKAAESERARRSGQIQELGLTDEEFQAATTDKAAFSKLVHKIAAQVAEARVGRVEPALGQTAQSLQEIQRDREFESVASQYKDFRTINDQGGLDPYLERGYDFKAAYAQYKLDHPTTRTTEPVDPRLKQAGAVSAGGQVRVNGQKVVKARNLDEALDAAFAEIQAGNKDFKIERETK